MLRKYTVKSLRVFLRLGSFIAAAGNMTLRKRRHLPNRLENLFESRRISRFDGLNFDCTTATHLTVPIIFSTLICLFIIHFYGAAICVKAVYSQNPQYKAFLGRKFLSSKILIVFDFVLQKSG